MRTLSKKMGAQNVITLLIALPVMYIMALLLVLFERRQGIIDMVQDALISIFGVTTDRYPFLILFCSLLLWEISFLVSTMSVAAKRDKPYDNRTPRNMIEKQSGLALRAQSAHCNEGEQFVFTFMAVLASLYLKNDIKWINYCCSGWILHRIPFHLSYWLNIDALRSFCYICSFQHTLFLILSCVYSVNSVEAFFGNISTQIFDNLIKDIVT